MKGLDTNILVRFLVGDDERQAHAVRSLFLEAEEKGVCFFVPIPVTLELIWVLSSVYHYANDEIVGALKGLLSLSILSLECHDRIARLCRCAARPTAGLADLLIALSASDNGCSTTLTFDKKAAGTGYFTLVGG